MNSYLNYTRSYCYAAVEVPDRPRRPAERRRVPARADRGAARLLPQPAPPAGGGPARSSATGSSMRSSARSPRPARPCHRGRLPLRQSDVRGLRSPAKPPDGRLRAHPVRDRGAAGPGRLRGDVDGVQRLEHPGRVAGGEPARPHRAIRADPRLRGRGTLPGRAPESGRTSGSSCEGGRLTNNTERHRFGPWGLFGGQPVDPASRW